MDDDEILDLVNSQDRVIGTVLRSQTGDLSNKGFLRAAEAFIQNRHGQLWIPRRQMNKRIAPGGLDYSMGEHVKSGEGYLAGCIRGFGEELNLEVKPKELQFINKFDPTGDLDYFRSLYLYKSDDVPPYNTEDFSGYYWLKPQDVLEMLKSGEPAKRSLLESITYLINN
jgi:isopentenyldiphosphate isomerase